MSGKRIFGFLILIVLTLVGLLWPLMANGGSSGTSSVDPVTITRYIANYNVSSEGLLTATETITARFPPGRHGLFRIFAGYDNADPNARYLPTIQSITLDGKPEPYETSWIDGDKFYQAKIGDANVFVSMGAHTYELKYTIPGVIAPASAGEGKTFETTAGGDVGDPKSAFYWDAVALGWTVPIDQALIKVTLPSPSEQVQCSVGTAAGVPGPCTVKGAGTRACLQLGRAR